MSDNPIEKKAPTLLEKMVAEVDKDGPLTTTVLAQAVPYDPAKVCGCDAEYLYVMHKPRPVGWHLYDCPANSKET